MTSGHRVLVVDDDQDIREGLRELLEDHGHLTITAQDGREALELLARADPRPCIIFLDLMMPIMDGRTFRQEQLRKPELAHIPVVVVSAYQNVDAWSRDLGVAEWLAKPLDLAALLRTVHRHCAGL